MTHSNKLVIITAPSGAGKTTVVKYLLDTIAQLQFSISATTRVIRNNETEGKDYYFISVEKFLQYIKENKFIEWQQVYPGKYYGTLKSEMDRIWKEGKTVIFDLDVRGAENLQNLYPENTVSIFIKPPSPEILIERLKNRKSETPESLAIRLERVKMELQQEHKFNYVIVNDELENTFKQARRIITNFLQIN